MSVDVVFPQEVLVALREQPQDFRKRVFIYTLGKLYETGRISGGLGAVGTWKRWNVPTCR